MRSMAHLMGFILHMVSDAGSCLPGACERHQLGGYSLHGDETRLLELLRHGANPNTRDGLDSCTALHSAARKGYPEVAQKLLQHNADLNIQDSDGEIPLHMVLRDGNTNVARLLLEQGVDVNSRSKDGSTPLYLASKDGWPKVARLLIEHGADIGAGGNEGITSLQVARSDIVELLSDYGPK